MEHRTVQHEGRTLIVLSVDLSGKDTVVYEALARFEQ